MSIRKFGFIIVSVLLISCSSAYQLKSLQDLPAAVQEGNLIETTPELLDQTIKSLKDRTLVVEFETDWCPICKVIKRPMQRLASQSEGRFTIVRVDVTDNIDPLVAQDMKPVYPGFIVLDPKLKTPVRKYGLDGFNTINKWLKEKKDRPYEVPLQMAGKQAVSPAKAIIVAGSNDNANFAQEMVWVRDLLREKGLRKEDVLCYYAKPDPVGYLADKKQFDELAPGLGECQEAEKSQILAAIKTSLAANPESFFFYASAHGAAPHKSEGLKEEAEVLKCMPHAPALVLVEADKTCELANFLTPAALASAIPKGNKTAKTWVFQGCYTGGFISPSNDPAKDPSPLAALPHSTILTASRSDRASFGCSPGTVTTVYGASFLKALLDAKGQAPNFAWPELARDIEESVWRQEKSMGIRERSEPQFFQTP